VIKQLLVSDHSKQKMHDTFLPMWNLLQVFFKHILLSPTNFTGIPNSARILCNIHHLTESQAFSKPMNNSYTVSLYTLFFTVSTNT